jgi:hypothetical protein
VKIIEISEDEEDCADKNPVVKNANSKRAAVIFNLFIVQAGIWSMLIAP